MFDIGFRNNFGRLGYSSPLRMGSQLFTPRVSGSLFDELDRVFDSFPTNNISYNKYKKENNVIMEIALPGFKKEEIKVTLDSESYFICVEGSKEDKEENKEFETKQFNTCSVKSYFEIPYEVDTENITSKFEDGVLKLIMPLVEEKVTKERVIEIQ